MHAGITLNLQDFAISIAAIHHLSTAERRQRAVQVSAVQPKGAVY